MALIDERRAQRFSGNAAATAAATTPAGSPVALTARPGGGNLVTVGGVSLALPEISGPPGPVYEAAKRGTDVFVAALFLVAAMPFLLVIAALIYAEDGGPIFYYQERVGRDGKRFRFYKFRSMVQNADAIKAQLMAQNEASGPIFKMKNDPRVTRVGRVLRRTSLDELPQFINVLRGEMSLVGPRPHLPREVAQYATERHHQRLKVQPGLLCFREVTGRSNLTFDQWMELDLLYIDHRCLQTDLRILMRAIPAILSGEGAH